MIEAKSFPADPGLFLSMLLHAVSGRFTGALHYLVRLKPIQAVINGRDHCGRSPLFIAIELANEPMAKALLAAGGDPNPQLPDGSTLVHWCVSNELYPVLTALVKCSRTNALPDNSGLTPGHLAASLGDVNALEIIFQEPRFRNVSLELTSQGESAYTLAIKNNHVDAAVCIVRNIPSLQTALVGPPPKLKDWPSYRC